MPTDIPALSTPFYKRCASAVDGIACKDYSAETTANISYGMDECEEEIQATTRALSAKHSWSGEVLGENPAGICLETVGNAMATVVSFLWENNGVSGGTLINTRANYSESSSDYAKFSLDADQKPNI